MALARNLKQLSGKVFKSYINRTHCVGQNLLENSTTKYLFSTTTHSDEIKTTNFIDLWNKQTTGLFWATWTKYYGLEKFRLHEKVEEPEEDKEDFSFHYITRKKTVPPAIGPIQKPAVLSAVSLISFCAGNENNLDENQQKILYDSLVYWTEGILNENEIKNAINESKKLDSQTSLQMINEIFEITLSKEINEMKSFFIYFGLNVCGTGEKGLNMEDTERLKALGVEWEIEDKKVRTLLDLYGQESKVLENLTKHFIFTDSLFW